MGFAAEIDAWLRGLLARYLHENTEALARALEPAIVAWATLYLMVFGFLWLTGRIEAPLTETLKRFGMMAFIFGVGVNLWLYEGVVVDAFFEAPGQLAAQIIGAAEPITIIDQIIFTGGDAAALLLRKGGILDGNLPYYLAAIFVYLAVGITAIYTLFLLLLSRVALAVLLSLGPLFIAALFYQSTTRLCEAWLAQLTTYALVAVLTVLVASLMLHVLTVEAQRAVRVGADIEITDAVRVCLACGLTFLMMRQVPHMAAALGNGVALSTYSVVSRGANWALSGATRTATQVARGAFIDKGETTRWDSLSRKAGQRAYRGAQWLLSRRQNRIRVRQRATPGNTDPGAFGGST